MSRARLGTSATIHQVLLDGCPVGMATEPTAACARWTFAASEEKFVHLNGAEFELRAEMLMRIEEVAAAPAPERSSEPPWAQVAHEDRLPARHVDQLPARHVESSPCPQYGAGKPMVGPGEEGCPCCGQ